MKCVLKEKPCVRPQSIPEENSANCHVLWLGHCNLNNGIANGLSKSSLHPFEWPSKLFDSICSAPKPSRRACALGCRSCDLDRVAQAFLYLTVTCLVSFYCCWIVKFLFDAFCGFSQSRGVLCLSRRGHGLPSHHCTAKKSHLTSNDKLR